MVCWPKFLLWEEKSPSGNEKEKQVIGWKWASRLHPVWPSQTAGGVLQHIKRGHWLCSSLQQVALWTQSSFPNPSPLSSGSEEGERYRISPQTQLFSLLLTKLEPTPFPQENSKSVLPPALTLPSPFFFSLDNLLWPEWHPLVAFTPHLPHMGTDSEQALSTGAGGGAVTAPQPLPFRQMVEGADVNSSCQSHRVNFTIVLCVELHVTNAILLQAAGRTQLFH